jgi:hypothetical protein
MYAPLYWDRLDSGDEVGDEVLYVQPVSKYPRVLCSVMIVVVVGTDCCGIPARTAVL